MTVDIPKSYHDTSGELLISLYSISFSNEWNTNLSISAIDKDNNVCGNAIIRNVNFKRNKITAYKGSLFDKRNNTNITLNDEWEEYPIIEW